VLISGGVGWTPMVSMASTLVAEGSKRDVRFVHACRSGAVHAFRDWLNDTVREHANFKRTVLYELVGPNDRAGVDHDLEGRLTPERVQQYALVPDADYYICGPIAFMKAQRDALVALGVAPEHQHRDLRLGRASNARPAGVGRRSDTRRPARAGRLIGASIGPRAACAGPRPLAGRQLPLPRATRRAFTASASPSSTFTLSSQRCMRR
jgi:ferredoxin-NADP reductase